jgi:hypothetical protein
VVSPMSNVMPTLGRWYHLVMTFTGLAMVGIDGPNRNAHLSKVRWFTVLNKMVDLPMANWQSHNQMGPLVTHSLMIRP